MRPLRQSVQREEKRAQDFNFEAISLLTGRQMQFNQEENQCSVTETGKVNLSKTRLLATLEKKPFYVSGEDRYQI